MPVVASAQSYTFATFTFDQSHTVDSGTSLSAGTYNGAIVTSAPTTTASVAGFPSTTVGFDVTKSVGRLLGLSSTSSRAVNLPNGNNGATARSGFTLTWSGGRKLYNLTGDDFVIYESASNPTSPEGYAVQVYRVDSATWSAWYYEPADTFQLYTGQPANGEGAHATALDLSSFGLSAGEPIDKIRVVNLTDEDRMQSANGIGVVLPEDAGATSSYLPAPGPLASYTNYGSATLDADPLYVGALHVTSTTACGNGVIDSGEQCDVGADVANDCCSGTCQYETDLTTCSDGLFCTDGDRCQAGSCEGSQRDCGDANDCTADSCNESSDQCVHDGAALAGAACSDGSFCTLGDTCAGGACNGSANTCDDANPCTQDACNEGADQCDHDASALNGTGCDDGAFCTTSDSCQGGTCSGTTRDCADSNGCTYDSCDEEADQCDHDAAVLNGTACDDGLFCTNADTCVAGSCSGGPAACDDGQPCTSDSCDEGAEQCTHETAPLDGTPCEDGLYCTTAGECSSGVCNGSARICDDGNECTQDSCDEELDQCVGDAEPFNGSGCDDGSYCTTGDQCSSGVCGGAALDCNDDNACTADSCSEELDQCTHESASLDGSGCEDGLFCTLNDRCQSGLCAGTANSCGDANGCTQDSCDEDADQCTHETAALDGSVCEDSDPCTAGGTCSSGSCSAGPAIETCGDGMACGIEECDDGNDDDLDGCSAKCDIENTPSSAQKTCIKKLNAAGARLAQTQGKAARGCLKEASNGGATDAQDCLEQDASGRIQTGREKTERTLLKSCPDTPALGETDTEVINDAAVDESIALVGDFFGADLGAAAIRKSDDPDGARCQAAIMTAYEKLAAAERREFQRCKGAGLDDDSIRSRGTLGACVGSILSDATGKVGAARARLSVALASKCAGVSVGSALPGVCATAVDPAECIVSRVHCRVCRMLNRMDALTEDCDAFDDGSSNASCRD